MMQLLQHPIQQAKQKQKRAKNTHVRHFKIGKKETCSIVSRRKSGVSEKTTVTVVLPHVFSY